MDDLLESPETESPAAEAAEAKDYKKILDQILTREKFFKDGWWKQADRANKIYSDPAKPDAGDSQQTPYNILYSNTEVLLPSLYSATPKPDVRPRFKGEDIKPIPQMLDRFLTILADPASPGSESLNNAMQENVLSSLVPGMGFVRLRYYPGAAVPISFESGHYKGLIWGTARKWAKVPWIAFRHEMTKEDIEEKFKILPEEMVKFNLARGTDEEEGKDGTPKNSTVVYEYWAKNSDKICYLCEDWTGNLITEEEDHLKLENKFPTPGPLLLTLKPGKLEPIPLYVYYQNQAEELNRVTVRLNKVLAAIKVRGAYSTFLGTEMAQILNSDETENALVPAGESIQLAQTGGFEKNIWLLPIEKLVTVATQLYTARQQIKQVIYELTGISDIIRGSSVASETATAQDLKNKWGTIRLRRMQALVADYVRDLFRQAVECGAQVVSPEKWQSITQLGIPLAQEKQIAQMQLQHSQQLQQQNAAYLQAMGQPAPQPQPPNPEVVKTAQSPSMEELLAKISSDANRTYTINVQTSSTIDLDTAADKDDLNAFMNAVGQLMAGLAPLAQMGPTGVAAAKQILVSVTQRFKFGQEIAEAVEAIDTQPPAPQGQTAPKPDPAIAAEIKQLEQLKAAQAQQLMQLKEAQSQLAISQSQGEAAKQNAMKEIEIARKEFQSYVTISKAELQLATKQAQAAQTAAKKPVKAKPGA